VWRWVGIWNYNTTGPFPIYWHHYIDPISSKIIIIVWTFEGGAVFSGEIFRMIIDRWCDGGEGKKINLWPSFIFHRRSPHHHWFGGLLFIDMNGLTLVEFWTLVSRWKHYNYLFILLLWTSNSVWGRGSACVVVRQITFSTVSLKIE